MDRTESLLSALVAIGVALTVISAFAVYDLAYRTVEVHTTSPPPRPVPPMVTVTEVEWSGNVQYNASCYGYVTGEGEGFSYPAGTNVTVYATLGYPAFTYPTTGCPNTSVTLENVTALTPGFKVAVTNLPITISTNATDVPTPAEPIVAVTVTLPTNASVGVLTLNSLGS